jgi:hypothetical protein
MMSGAVCDARSSPHLLVGVNVPGVNLAEHVGVTGLLSILGDLQQAPPGGSAFGEHCHWLEPHYEMKDWDFLNYCHPVPQLDVGHVRTECFLCWNLHHTAVVYRTRNSQAERTNL